MTAVVLPVPARMRSRAEFSAVVRDGRRAGSTTLVVHALECPAGASGELPRVGFVVGRTVGGAVTRNRTRRRLRHLMRERLVSIPDGPSIIVRALAPAGTASVRELGSDLDRCLARLIGPPR